MRYIAVAILFFLIRSELSAQIDPSLLKRVTRDTGSAKLNMDAVYSRPMLNMGRLPVAIGGYAEANYQYISENGISEGHQFQMRRVSIFISSAIGKRMKFLSEIEFEDGAKEINVEFASLDIEAAPLLNFRGGIVMNPIGSFNQNHDGPKWEFIDRPISATQLLPATWSNAGFGIYGKRSTHQWVYGYELYLTNGFDDRIISNTLNKTFLPASKNNIERFEESFNGQPLVTAKIAVRKKNIGELGLSYMGGVYNKFEDDGISIDKKRHVRVYAVDFNSVLPGLSTSINGEFAWIHVDVPGTYSEQFGRSQRGGFVDLVQPVIKKPMFGFEHAVLNISARLEYVDWNRGKFNSTGENISDHVFSVVPAISWRPSSETVIRLNYRYNWQKDLLGNPPSKLGGVQFGFATYF